MTTEASNILKIKGDYETLLKLLVFVESDISTFDIQKIVAGHMQKGEHVDGNTIDVTLVTNDNEVEFWYNTLWCGQTYAIDVLAKLYPELNFEHRYIEYMSGERGYSIYKNGIRIEHNFGMNKEYFPLAEE